jgi:hypothetical protein
MAPSASATSRFSMPVALARSVLQLQQDAPPGVAVISPGAGTRWSTLVYVEKVRPQFLSLRQLAHCRLGELVGN